MSADCSTAQLRSFDRQTRLSVRVQRPAREDELTQLPEDCPRIARGGGVSYVAASFGEDAVSQSMAAFDRLLAFDAERGSLRVEAGASVAAVQAFALARGWYLAVAPGHPLASVGGCIAANVHGKNPARDGCFGAVTGALRLFHPRLGWRQAEPGDALWRASVGGLGLTGSIIEATLQLRRAPAAVRLEALPVASLAEAAALLRAHAEADILYGWHDGQASRFGRGLIRVGCAQGAMPAAPLPRTRLPASVPVAPFRLWHPATLALANGLLARRWAPPRELALGAALLPLNDARGYFAAYGPRGLLECQWLIPHAPFEDFAAGLERLVRRHRPLLPLISSKLFAGADQGVALSGEGIALAVHTPAHRDGQRFADDLAALALDHGGRPNPIKQSGLGAATLRRALPGLDGWRQAVAAHNPGGLLRSDLLRRLQLA